jgi:hypothetical protein
MPNAAMNPTEAAAQRGHRRRPALGRLVAPRTRVRC